MRWGRGARSCSRGASCWRSWRLWRWRTGATHLGDRKSALPSWNSMGRADAPAWGCRWGWDPRTHGRPRPSRRGSGRAGRLLFVDEVAGLASGRGIDDLAGDAGDPGTLGAGGIVGGRGFAGVVFRDGRGSKGAVCGDDHPGIGKDGSAESIFREVDQLETIG